MPHTRPDLHDEKGRCPDPKLCIRSARELREASTPQMTIDIGFIDLSALPLEEPPMEDDLERDPGTSTDSIDAAGDYTPPWTLDNTQWDWDQINRWVAQEQIPFSSAQGSLASAYGAALARGLITQAQYAQAESQHHWRSWRWAGD